MSIPRQGSRTGQVKPLFFTIFQTARPSGDKPTSALLTELGQRGLLDDTLVLFGSEFGHLSMAQGPDGRDHNITGYSMFLTGAAVKKGRMHTNDLHATLLALMGERHKELTTAMRGGLSD